MSDCSTRAWHIPEQREPGVLYMHGHPGTDYAAVTAIEVDGQRFERVTYCRKCKHEQDGMCMLSDGMGDFKRWCVDEMDYCSDGEVDADE